MGGADKEHQPYYSYRAHFVSIVEGLGQIIYTQIARFMDSVISSNLIVAADILLAEVISITNNERRDIIAAYKWLSKILKATFGSEIYMIGDSFFICTDFVYITIKLS